MKYFSLPIICFYNGKASITFGMLIMLIVFLLSLGIKESDYNKPNSDIRSIPPFWINIFTNDTNQDVIDSNQLFMDSNSVNIINNNRFIMGTDHLGRDVFKRSLSSSHVYYFPVFTSVFISLILGILLGISQNYLPNILINRTSSFFIDFLESFPRFMILLILFSIFKLHIYTIMVFIGLFNAPRIAKMTSNKIDSLKKNEYIEAAFELGKSEIRIVLVDILFYACKSFIIIQIPLLFAETVLIETSLSFLGIGIQGEAISWGYLVAEGKSDLIMGHYWVAGFPALLIILIIFSAHIITRGTIKWFEYNNQ